MIKRLKLKHQLNLLVLLTILMFCFFVMLFYTRFRTITYNRAESTAQQMIRQVAQNVTMMMESVEDTARGLSYDQYVQKLLVSEDRTQDVVLYNYVSQVVTTVKASNSNIYSVTWLGKDQRRISDPSREENDIVSELFSRYDLDSDPLRKPEFSSVIHGRYNARNYFGYIFPVYSLYEIGLPKAGYGVIVLDSWEMEKLIKITNITENSLFAVLDQNNNVVVSNRSLSVGDVFPDIFWDDESLGNGNATVEYEDGESIANCIFIEDTGWKVVSMIPREDLIGDYHEVLKEGMLALGICCLVLILFGHMIIRSISEPIHAIVDFLHQAGSSTLRRRIEIPQQNEIAVIAASINTALDRIETMTQENAEHQAKRYEAELAERDAKVAVLQSQINPHFLYNTLNCISSMGLAYDIPEISEIAVAMSNIYRYSIKGERMVPLRRELQCIREYMRIMDIRFGGKFETEYRFDDAVLELYTLRMTLQPIVENAVYHGMELRNQKGRLTLEGQILEDRLVLTVTDNGKGMSRQALDELRKQISDYENASLFNAEKSSIGISNINKRIKIQFGEQFGLTVESKEGAGTRVTLELPAIHESEAQRKGDFS